jgi:hypothetical protein
LEQNWSQVLFYKAGAYGLRRLAGRGDPVQGYRASDPLHTELEHEVVTIRWCCQHGERVVLNVLCYVVNLSALFLVLHYVSRTARSQAGVIMYGKFPQEF